jgi:fucose 4-O-acetylase-like acetyltransferase
MAKLSIGFGVVLILLGMGGFMATGNMYPTALIPTWFGLAMAVSGLLANTREEKRRMLWMHVAAALGLLGCLSAAIRAIIVLVQAHGVPLTGTVSVAVWDQVAMAAVCLLFVLLCVRSFIAARKERINAV